MSEQTPEGASGASASVSLVALAEHHVRALRATRGLSQEALVDLATLHRTYVGSIERSERNVSLHKIEKMAVALGVDICDLLAPE